MLAEIEKRLEGLGSEERRERASLIERLAELAVGGGREELSRLEAALDALEVYEARREGGEGPEERTARIPERPVADVHAARARATLRILMDRIRLREESYGAGEVARVLGVGRERLRRMRNQGSIVGIVERERSPAIYPYWQFSSEGKILEGVEEVVAASREADMDPETLHFFMTEPNDRLGGSEPAELLREGEVERLIRVIESSGLEGF
ncbi:MAG: hypothetical protein ACRDSJ_03725 [Rubrobacteraceae bacterium]